MAPVTAQMTAAARRRGSSAGDRPGLLLTPSRGFGGGIERVAEAVERALPGIVRVDLYDSRRHVRASGNGLAKVQFAARAVYAAARLQPRHVLCLHAAMLPVAALAAASARAPLFLFALGTEVWAPMSAAARRLVCQCRRVIAISEYTAHWTARRAGIPRSQLAVVHLPISQALASLGVDDPDRLPTGGTLLTVSRLVRQHRYKGHFEIAKALPRVLETCPRARWTVVGGGDDAPALRARCVELGVAERVTLTSGIGDEALGDHYRGAAAMVLPSVADASSVPPIGEGFGLVYAEAGAFAVPSIASTAGGGALDFVAHDRTGLLVAPGAGNELADAMVAMLKDADRRSRLGKNARALVRERHLPEHFAAGLGRALS